MFSIAPELQRQFPALKSGADFWSLRHVQERHYHYGVRKGIPEPPRLNLDQGAMLTARVAGVEAYAATSDTTPAGLQTALDQAEALARSLAGQMLIDSHDTPVPETRSDDILSGYEQPLPSAADCLALLAEIGAGLPRDPRLIDSQARLGISEVEQIHLNSTGACLRRAQRYLYPGLNVTASDDRDSQTRTLGGFNFGRQGGLEVIEQLGLREGAARVADEALQLLLAPNTPDAVCDLLLMPDQMILQIHESIGHPLELDRILGDERNYAGTSFIRPGDFGRYQYGSPLLNVTFDPQVPGELASYRHDDDGSTASREYLIRDGRLLRPLGGSLSQQRSGLPGVACSRASSWNRPSMDRMANLNLEPGSHSLAQLIGGIERGILMSSNRSWSIDDARNKFQFGCEWGQLIENGELRGVVKNPNYRGISASFWRNLSAVGNRETWQKLGTPFCGKGEPNQLIRVGHASPACVFSSVNVFGGAC